jgi:ubiquinone/menaquinone biosynthesis C-methylase UbiE
MLQKIEKYVPEGIPFPSTRIYCYFARFSPFTRDSYRYVAEQVAQQIVTGRVLDVGTGPGYLPIEIVKLARGVEVTGIDVSKDMVRMAGKNAQKSGVDDRVRFEYMDANDMRYRDSCFDLVLSTGSFHHWKKPVRVLNEIHRVLKDGGQAWIYDIRKDAPPEGIEKLKEMYGGFAGPIIYRMISFHSSVTKEEFQNVLENPENSFKAYELRTPFPFALAAVLFK